MYLHGAKSGLEWVGYGWFSGWQSNRQSPQFLNGMNVVWGLNALNWESESSALALQTRVSLFLRHQFSSVSPNVHWGQVEVEVSLNIQRGQVSFNVHQGQVEVQLSQYRTWQLGRGWGFKLGTRQAQARDEVEDTWTWAASLAFTLALTTTPSPLPFPFPLPSLPSWPSLSLPPLPSPPSQEENTLTLAPLCMASVQCGINRTSLVITFGSSENIYPCSKAFHVSEFCLSNSFLLDTALSGIF